MAVIKAAKRPPVHDSAVATVSPLVRQDAMRSAARLKNASGNMPRFPARGLTPGTTDGHASSRSGSFGLLSRAAVTPEVDLFQVDLASARQTSERSHRRHVGLGRQIPVGSASQDHPVRRRSKGQVTKLKATFSSGYEEANQA